MSHGGYVNLIDNFPKNYPYDPTYMASAVTSCTSFENAIGLTIVGLFIVGWIVEANADYYHRKSYEAFDQ